MVHRHPAVTVTWHERLPSTMDEAHRLAALGASHGTAVAARVQDGGRGRRGRAWASPVGGLWLSMVCRPPDPAGAACLSLRAGLAVADLLERLVPGAGPIQLKWPNDLLRGGRKLAGILCEARWDGASPGHVIIGIGLNVANRLPDELAASATSLADLTPAPSPESLAGPVAAALAEAAGRPGPLEPTELVRWDQRDGLRGRPVTIGSVSGIASGITPDGALAVRLASGETVAVGVGEVVMGGAGART